MSLKSKIITKIKEKVKSQGVNLSNVRINAMAEKLDAIVDNEDDIDGEIDKLDQVFSFKELAALDDTKRSADKKAAEEADKGGEGDADEQDADEATDKGKGNEMPAWFKAHTESQNKVIETLTSKLTALEQSKTAQTRRQRLEAKLKDAPERFRERTLRDFDRMKVDSDEDFTEYLADIEQDVADEVQAQSDAGLGGDAPTRGSSGKLKEEEVSSEMKELIAERKAAAEATAKTA